MIICNLAGGLGNQMFQYACARALSKDLNQPLKFTTDFFGAYNAHNGLELERVFGLKLEKASSNELGSMIGFGRRAPALRRILGKRRFLWLAGQRFLGEPHYRYWPCLLERARHGGYLQGYWQSERYFAHYAQLIRTDFRFRNELQGENVRIANAISREMSVSVHVRRGDYVSNAKTLAVHGICSLEYYRESIDKLQQKYPGARLFVFSDDPQWVSQMLRPHYPNMVLVDHNKGTESYNDMRLMSMCKHNIIANSSFSWWGAWLNVNPEKMAIAPVNWFANGTDSRDLIPKTWECM